MISAERQLVEANEAASQAAAAVDAATSAVHRAEAGQGDLAFTHTDRAYKVQLVEKRRLQIALAGRRLALAKARYELAKAQVADDNSLPEAVDIDLQAFRDEVEVTASAVAEAQREVDDLTRRLAILKKAVHTARVASLRRTAAP